MKAIIGKRYKWSKMDSEQYKNVIEGIKLQTGKNGLWSIEEHWEGHQ